MLNITISTTTSSTMKFTIFALLAGLCVVAVSANVALKLPVEELDFDENYANDNAEDITDFGSNNSWLGFFFMLRKALSTVMGIECTMKEVVAIQGAAETFVDDVQACGGDVSKEVKKLIYNCKAITSTSNDIIHLNENLCANSSSTTDSDDDISFKCFVKLLYKTMKLNIEVNHAVSLIKKIPSVPGVTGDCVGTAVGKLSSVFTEFPSHVKICSNVEK